MQVAAQCYTFKAAVVADIGRRNAALMQPGISVTVIHTAAPVTASSPERRPLLRSRVVRLLFPSLSRPCVPSLIAAPLPSRRTVADRRG